MSTTQSSSTWRERLSAPLTWHLAGFILLLALAVAMAVRLGFDWTAMDSHSSDILAGKQLQLKALELQTAPLRGLDQRVEKTRRQLDDFYRMRVPPNYSSIDARIGELQVGSGVRLSRVQYTQGAPGFALTEISLDASITGALPLDKIALAYGCRNPKCKWKGTFHPAQLEFHHFDPTLKKFQIGKAADYSFKAIAAEINKCIVLCACCHALFHVGLVTLSESYICRINENLEITNDTE